MSHPWRNLLTEEQEKALFKGIAELKRAGFGTLEIQVDKGKIRFFVTTSELVVDER